ncbi:MAG: PEP-CTERM sorting domain-containing protein [Bryobacterales bacterium]|nr:PEP-CTERM sorting domain-containing protein [Bryobacterales bacterium]
MMLLSVTNVVAAPVVCETKSLAYYQATHTMLNPCSQGPLIFEAFAFQKTSVAGTITAADITVTPDGVDGFNFFTPKFNGTFPVLERYAISYIVDPAPILAGDELSLDPPEGGIKVTKYSCVDDILYFSNINNPSTYVCAIKNVAPYSLTVTPANLEASLTYPSPGTIVSVLLIIELQGTVKDLEGILSDNPAIPEPATFSMMGGAIAGLALLRRSRRR